jgi:hypothetical protein
MALDGKKWRTSAEKLQNGASPQDRRFFVAQLKPSYDAGIEGARLHCQTNTPLAQETRQRQKEVRAPNLQDFGREWKASPGSGLAPVRPE